MTSSGAAEQAGEQEKHQHQHQQEQEQEQEQPTKTFRGAGRRTYPPRLASSCGSNGLLGSIGPSQYFPSSKG